ncbi:hypothetical protein GGR53DRAFT_167345 [Hypoxylon sp. FL1150]|nr:hypothetical protein GGR53DRAFT_167345 [Hypoxylon sp. FL1150]
MKYVRGGKPLALDEFKPYPRPHSTWSILLCSVPSPKPLWAWPFTRAHRETGDRGGIAWTSKKKRTNQAGYKTAIHPSPNPAICYLLPAVLGTCTYAKIATGHRRVSLLYIRHSIQTSASAFTFIPYRTILTLSGTFVTFPFVCLLHITLMIPPSFN